MRTWLAALAAGAGLCCTTGVFAQAPANDLCSNAVALSVNTTYIASNSMATATNDGPAPTCQTSFGKSVWYTFNPATTGNYQVSMCGSLYDSVVTVFDVVDCTTFVNANFHQVGCDDDSCGAMPGPTATASGNASLIATLAMTAGTNYYVRVSGFSTNGGIYQVGVYDLSANGACCTNTGACSVVAATACATTGTAYFLGAGSTCTVNPCVGACCNNTSGTCAVTQPGTANCVSGNTFMGYGSSCTVNPCTLASCCTNTGTCTLTTALACSNSATSVYNTSGTSCSPTNPCTALLGACCSSTGTCTQTLSVGCTSPSGFLGAGVACSPTNPCTALLGACCSTSGTCSTAIAAGCTGTSTFQGAGSVCTPNPCGGACCVGPVCSIATSTGCTGAFQGLGSLCSPNPCGGSCCQPTGTCTLTVNAAACPTGVFTLSGICSTNTCAVGNDNCSFPMPSPFHYTTDFTVSGATDMATNDGSFAGITGNTIAGCLPTNTAATPNSRREVYFSFTPSANGSLNADLCSTLPSYDSVLSIHSACGATVGNTLACNDDGACSAGVGLSQIVGLPVTGGTTYIIRVARYTTATTATAYNYMLNVTTAAVGACCKADGTCLVATNAACIGAPNNGTYMGNATTCGTVSCTGACCDNTSAACTATGASACGSGSTYLGVGTVCSPSPCVGQACCSTSTGACTLIGNSGTCAAGSVSAGANTTCSPTPCVVSTCCNTATGVCTVNGSDPCPSGSTSNVATSCTVNPCPQPPPPTNDDCATASVATVGTQSGSNIFATESVSLTNVAGDPFCTQTTWATGAPGNQKDVYWSFTAPATASYNIDTCGSSIDTIMSIHSDCPASQANLIACNDDSTSGTGNIACTNTVNSRMPNVTLTSGQTYYIRVFGYNNATGTLILNIAFNNGTGSCCVVATCTVTDAANCTGTFLAGGGCIPNICLPPGVCCRGSTCTTTITNAADCASSITSGTAGSSFPTGAACNTGPLTNSPCCYADYNKVGGITVTDIFNFLSDWFAGSPFARVGGDGGPGNLSVQNIFDFLSDWFAGGCAP